MPVRKKRGGETDKRVMNIWRSRGLPSGSGLVLTTGVPGERQETIGVQQTRDAAAGYRGWEGVDGRIPGNTQRSVGISLQRHHAL